MKDFYMLYPFQILNGKVLLISMAMVYYARRINSHENQPQVFVNFQEIRIMELYLVTINFRISLLHQQYQRHRHLWLHRQRSHRYLAFQLEIFWGLDLDSRSTR